MKSIYTTLFLLITTLFAYAQAPNEISYQAVIRNSNDQLMPNQALGMQVSILQGSVTGTPVYVETHTPTTNINGLVTISIGTGSVITGTFATIDWSDGPYFIKTETDLAGGTNYTVSGTTGLLSVPYALHANTAESVTGDISANETDPSFNASVASSITAADTAHWNQHTVDTQIDSAGIATLGYVAGPHTINTDSQTISLSGNDLSISNGNTIDISSIDTDTQLDSAGVAALGFVAGAHTVDTDDQTISLSGNDLSISNGNTIDISSIDTDTQLDSAGVAALGFVAGAHTIDTDDQTLSLSGSNLSIADGNTIDISSIDTDTQLDSAGVAALGFVAGAHTVDTDDQTISLSGSNLSIADGNTIDISSIDTDTQLDSAGVAALGFVAGAHTIDTDTKLDSAGIAAFGYVAGAQVTGANKQIGFNDNGAPGADSELIYDKSTNHMAIGTDSPNASAALEIKSTTGGLLLPRLTVSQRDALTPEVGMIIFNSDSGRFQGFAGYNSSIGLELTHNTFLGNLTMSGQSFTATSNEYLSGIELIFQTGGASTLKIYLGHQSTGTPIYTQAINPAAGQQVINLTTPLLLTSGQAYTFTTDLTCGHYPFHTYGGGSAFTVNLAFPGDLWMKLHLGGAEWKDLHD